MNNGSSNIRGTKECQIIDFTYSLRVLEEAKNNLNQVAIFLGEVEAITSSDNLTWQERASLNRHITSVQKGLSLLRSNFSVARRLAVELKKKKKSG